jgi:hypothetical protein
LDKKNVGVSMGHSDHMLLLVQIGFFFLIPKLPSASANGRAKIMFDMTTTNGTIWHRIFHLIELNSSKTILKFDIEF